MSSQPAQAHARHARRLAHAAQGDAAGLQQVGSCWQPVCWVEFQGAVHLVTTAPSRGSVPFGKMGSIKWWAMQECCSQASSQQISSSSTSSHTRHTPEEVRTAGLAQLSQAPPLLLAEVCARGVVW